MSMSLDRLTTLKLEKAIFLWYLDLFSKDGHWRKYSQSEYFVSKQKDQHIMLQNILILNILPLCEKISKWCFKMLGTLWKLMIGFVVFLFLIALINTVGCNVTITNLVMIIIALVLGVSYLLTLSVNRYNVFLNNSLFFIHLSGSIEADKMSRSTFLS